MRAGMLSVLLAVAVFTASAPVLAQSGLADNEPLEHRRFSGAQIAEISRAWSAVQRERNPPAELEEFEITYLNGPDGSVTIHFFRGDTATPMPDGGFRIRHQTLFFSVLLRDGAVRVMPPS